MVSFANRGHLDHLDPEGNRDILDKRATLVSLDILVLLGKKVNKGHLVPRVRLVRWESREIKVNLDHKGLLVPEVNRVSLGIPDHTENRVNPGLRDPKVHKARKAQRVRRARTAAQTRGLRSSLNWQRLMVQTADWMRTRLMVCLQIGLCVRIPTQVPAVVSPRPISGSPQAARFNLRDRVVLSRRSTRATRI